VSAQASSLVSPDPQRWLNRLWSAGVGWAATPQARQLAMVLRVVMTVALLGFVVWRLMHFGWRNILQASPVSLGFFASFALCYAIAPVADFAIYRKIWPLTRADMIAFFRKRSLNEAVMDYAGEAWLFVWAKRRNLTGGADIARTVRDVNLLSGVASNLITLASLGFILLTGSAEKLLKVRTHLADDMLFGAVAVVATAAIVVGFRRFFFSMAARLQIYTAMIHALRNLLVMAATVLMWHFAVPGVATSDWMVFLSLQLLAYRFPFIPNRDLLMAGVGMALAPSLGTAATAVAAMFAAIGALFLLCNLAVVVLTSAGNGARRLS
jgi:hypothetical protein